MLIKLSRKLEPARETLFAIKTCLKYTPFLYKSPEVVMFDIQDKYAEHLEVTFEATYHPSDLLCRMH